MYYFFDIAFIGEPENVVVFPASGDVSALQGKIGRSFFTKDAISQHEDTVPDLSFHFDPTRINVENLLLTSSLPASAMTRCRRGNLDGSSDETIMLLND